MKRNQLILIILCAASVVISGCNTNISHINNDIRCPTDYSFQASYDNAWNAALEAAMSFSTIDTIDQQSGFMSTEIANVDGREMDLIDHALLGQTYKFIYDIRLKPVGPNETHIKTTVKLVYEQFLGVSKREGRNIAVEDYLRLKLYRQICENLFPGGNKCTNDLSAPIRQANYQLSSSQNESVSHNPQQREASGNSANAARSADPKLRTAQQYLKNAGYDPGPADGIMGKRTRNALKLFQQDNGLAVTGELDDVVLELLTSGNHVQPQNTEYASSRELLPSEPVPAVIPEQTHASADAPSTKKTKKKGWVVTTDTAYLLESADLYGAQVLSAIPAQTQLPVLAQSGDYYQVKYQGQEGYVYNSSISEQ